MTTAAELAPPWHITAHAVNRYLYARRWRDTEWHYRLALDELTRLAPLARYRATDANGRELWRTTPAHGSIRWVVVAPRARGDLPSVVWVGQGRPPVEAWRSRT